jgi:hypothetical protein
MWGEIKILSKGVLPAPEMLENTEGDRVVSTGIT